MKYCNIIYVQLLISDFFNNDFLNAFINKNVIKQIKLFYINSSFIHMHVIMEKWSNFLDNILHTFLLFIFLSIYLYLNFI